MTEALDRARRSLEIAEQLLPTDLPTAANRIYNAGENLGIAALSSVSWQVPKSHGKVWNGVHLLHQKGILREDYRPVLEQSYRLRIKGDYGRDVGNETIATKEALEACIASLKSFLKEVEALPKK